MPRKPREASARWPTFASCGLNSMETNDSNKISLEVISLLKEALKC